MTTSTRLPTCVLALATAVAFCSPALAQTDERLPWGAVKAGNADGSIPAWTGGLPVTTAPAGYKKDSGQWADPYAADKPLFSVTAKNIDQYADKMTDGIKEMLKRYPTFRVDVYPSRRPVNYSDAHIDNAKKNAAGRCKTIEGGEGLAGCFGGTPFPVPKTGHEAMWNFLLANRGNSQWTYGQGWYVDASGNKVMTGEVNNRYQNDYYSRDMTAEQFYAAGGQYLMNNNIYSGPARNVGEGNLQKKTVNPVASPDKTWLYTPGQRRVRLSPDAGYDFPVATSGGAMMYDEIYMFSGPMDRYEWKYLGTKEIFIPYNAYKFLAATPAQLMHKSHYNPDLVRFELHRVHVVEANLKPGARHVVPKRRFYFDEDIFFAGLADGWDASGKLSRVVANPAAWAYDKQAMLSGGTMYFDLATGNWYNSSVLGDYKGTMIDIDKVDTGSYYSAEGLSRRTQR